MEERININVSATNYDQSSNGISSILTTVEEMVHEDYEKIHEDDQISISQLDGFAPGKPVECNILHADKTSEKIMLNHSYNDLQLEWFKAGSAMNFLRKKQN